jgi:predicted dehydrogenase
MPSIPIRVGVVGAGANTRLHHIPKLQAIDQVTVATVCNRSAESTSKVADEFGIVGRAASWEEIIADPDIDAVVIGTWPYMHKVITLAALHAGKHVLTEARMAMTATEAKQMLEESRGRPNLIAQIVPSPMTLQWDSTIKRLLREGALGQVLHIDVRGIAGAALDTSKPMHWRSSSEFSGMNIMSMGIFYEAVRRWVGDANLVVAMGKTFVKTRLNPATGALASLKIPDHLDIIATMDCGAQLHMLISDVLVGKGRPTAEFWLYGTEADLHYQLGPGGGLFLHKHGGEREPVSAMEGEAGGWRVEAEFVSAIRGTEQISHTRFVDGVCYMEFTEAVQRSLGGAGAVPLPLC